MNTTIQNQLTTIIDKYIADEQIAGMNMLVRKNDEEILYINRGYADRASQKEIQRDTIFRLFSMTKPVTSAAMMLLFQRGLVDLTDPVSKYITTFKNQMVAVPGSLYHSKNQMTIQNLLSMTGGLAYGGTATAAEIATQNVFDEVHRRMYSASPVTTIEFAEKIGKCPLEYQPGANWKYCVAADVLGAVIEKIADMPFGEFLQKELFDPLEMKDTGFYVIPEKRERLASAYQITENELHEFHDDSLGIRMSMDVPPAYEAGGAGLVSTIDDYSNFASMLLHNGSFHGKQILLPATIEYMTSRRLTPDQQKGFDNLWGLHGFSYGNLIRIMTDPWKAPFVTITGEYGWDGWMGCYFANIPEKDMTILMMMQRTDTGTFDLTRKLRNVLLLNL